MRKVFIGLVAVLAACPAIASAADNKEFSQNVAATLRDSGRLSDYSISVQSTKDGAVTLKGRVANQEQMQEAMAMTRSMPGVSKVVNHMSIKPSAEHSARRANSDDNGGSNGGPQMSFPDPSLPAQNQTGHADLASRLKGTRSREPKKQLSSATAQAYAVRQASQTVPGNFTPGEGSQAMGGPAMGGPGMGGPGAYAKMAMAAPMVAAGAAAGAMGQCPPGAGGMGPGGPGMGMGGPMPMSVPAVGGGVAPARYDQPHMPNYAWPSYAAYPNYAAVAYPRQYSPTAWPYIGPFYPYPQVPLGWRKVMLEWDDGWWMLNFKQ